MATSSYLLLSLFLGFFFLSTPTLSRKILLNDPLSAPSPSDDTLTIVSSLIEAPINLQTFNEITISPSPQDFSLIDASTSALTYKKTTISPSSQSRIFPFAPRNQHHYHHHHKYDQAVAPTHFYEVSSEAPDSR